MGWGGVGGRGVKKDEEEEDKEGATEPWSCSRDWSRFQPAADWLASAARPSPWLLPPLSSQQGVWRSPSPLMLPLYSARLA